MSDLYTERHSEDEILNLAELDSDEVISNLMEDVKCLNEDIQKLQAEITKIRQGEKDMRDTITLYDKAITRIAHHIQDQGNARHFCTSGIDFDDGTAKEICDYITKINEELKRTTN